MSKKFLQPRMCPELKCTPLFQWPSDIPDNEPGESWHCFGCMQAEVVFEYDGNKHANDLRSCCYTPLKGLIAWQENRMDWWGMRRAYDRALKKLDEYKEK